MPGRKGLSPMYPYFDRNTAVSLGLIEVSPFTGYDVLTAKGAEEADEAAWYKSLPIEPTDNLVSFDPSKF
jgi:hypothetical protein